jgi:hypothetical protein
MMRALVSALAFSCLGPSAAVAAAPTRASADIDAGALADEAEAVTNRLESEVKALLLEREVLPATGPDDRRISITVRFGGTDDDPAYDVTLAQTHEGAVISGSERTFRCELCTHGELAGRVVRDLGPILDAIVAAQGDEPDPVGGEATSEATPSPTGDAGDELAAPAEGPELEPAGFDPHDERSGARDSSPLGPLGATGIGVGATGLAGIAAGVVLVATPSKPLEATQFRDQRVFQTPGVIVLSSGVTMAITGAVLLALDRIRAKRSVQSATLSATRAPTRTRSSMAAAGGT